MDLKEKIKSDPRYTVGALLAIYNRQTSTEKHSKSTSQQNDIGFNAYDAGILTDVTKFYLNKGYLTKNQMKMISSKMVKYIKQLNEVGVEPVELSTSPTEKPKPQTTETVKKVTVYDKDWTKLKVVFSYSRELVQVIKEDFVGRRFVPDEKCWIVPLTATNIQKLKELRFDIPSEVEDWYRKQTEGITSDISVPGLDDVLRPFQKEAVSFIDAKDGRVLIADSMGLGKSLESIAWIQLHQEKVFPIIITCPASVKLNWKNEIEKWTNFGKYVEILHGTTPYNLSINSKIIIINYDILKDWVDFLVSKIKPKLVIGDELHKIKGKVACKPQNQVKRTSAFLKLVKYTKYVMGLTGTPILNKPMEIYNPLRAIKPSLFPNFKAFAHRFCLPEDAPILMSDFTEKKISKIEIGDYVVGWDKEENKQRKLKEAKVLNVLKRKAPLQKMILTDGSIIYCTPDHRWLSGAGKIEKYIPAKMGKLTGGSKNAATTIARIPFVAKTPQYFESNDYMKGYLAGCFRGDGYCEKVESNKYYIFKNLKTETKIKYLIGIATKDENIINRASKYLKRFEIEHTIGTSDSGKLKGRKSGKDKLPAIRCGNKKTYDLLSNEKIDSKEWCAGFLAGMYDTDGSKIGISQSITKNKPNCELIRKAFKTLKIDYIEKPYGCNHISIMIHFSLTNGRIGLINFWNKTKPAVTRKLKSYMYGKAGGGLFTDKRKNFPRVKEIIPLEEQYIVYTLTTETGNYVAYGLGSKNCNPKYNGFAMDYGGASNLTELHQILTSECLLRRRKEDVAKELPSKSFATVSVELDNEAEYRKAEANLIKYLREIDIEKAKRANRAKTLALINTLKRLAIEGKMNQSIDWIADFIDGGEKLVVFTHLRETSELIENKFGNTCVKLIGGMTDKQKQNAEKEFWNNDKVRLFVGNIQAAGVGINLQCASNACFLEYPWQPGDYNQACDRQHRIGSQYPVTIWNHIAAGTIEEEMVKLLESKAVIANQAIDGADVDEESGVFNELLESLNKK